MPKSKISTAEKLRIVRTRLKRGDFAKIAERTGYDASHVRRVLMGERSNPSGEIVTAAYTTIGRRKAVK